MDEVEQTRPLMGIERFDFGKQQGRARLATRIAALGACLFFFATAFHSGWTRVETDFPNYYTAALLARKGLPLRNYYDWTWFQRQINLAGVEHQLGCYQMQTPLTAIPIMPLAGLRFQTAKRVWLLLNLGFLAGTLWLLWRITSFHVERLVLLTFLGVGSLYSNFLYGQYYVFLLFLLTLAFFLQQARPGLAGFICGATFGLKLYGGPFLLYFVAKRQWRAAAGFLVAALCCGSIAIALFGWADVHYYATQILPRAVEDVIDPYNAGNGTYSSLLRRVSMAEPELNPQPLWQAPLLFFFLRPFIALLLVGFTAIGLAKKQGRDTADFAWFTIPILLLSTSTSSYTFILLLLPIAVLLKDAKPGERFFLIAAFVALSFPLRAGWAWAFPRLWMLLAVFIVSGRKYLREVTPKVAAGVVIVAAVIAGIDAHQHMVSYAAEPGRRYERVASEPGGIFSGSPTVTRAGLFYEAMGTNGYVLHWFHDRRIEELAFEGHAFRPEAVSPDGPIQFELVAQGRSKVMLFDPTTRRVSTAGAQDVGEEARSVVSPDGKWVALVSRIGGTQQVSIENRATGVQKLMTGGKCNSFSPTWELDSKAIIFASDCDRGVGLPALYRARVPVGEMTK